MPSRPQRYYPPTTTPRAATCHSLVELRDLDPSPHRSEAQQPSMMDSYYPSDAASASFAPFAPAFRPPTVLSGCFAQPPRATTDVASASRGGSSASVRRGDAPSTAHRRALSATECEKLLLASPPRGDEPASCAFRRRRDQLAARSKELPGSNKQFLLGPASSSPRSFKRGSLFFFPADESTRKQSADGAEDATPSPRVFARSKAYSTPATMVVPHTLAPQGTPNFRLAAPHPAAQRASNEAAETALNAAAETAPSAAGQAASGVFLSGDAWSFFPRIASNGCQAGCTASALGATPSSSTPASPTCSASSPAARTYTSSSSPSSPRFLLPCTTPSRTGSPPTSSSPPTSTSSATTTSRKAEDEAGRYQSVCVKPCLTAPSSTFGCSSEAGSPSRSPKRVSFVKYVEIREYIA